MEQQQHHKLLLNGGVDSITSNGVNTGAGNIVSVSDVSEPTAVRMQTVITSLKTVTTSLPPPTLNGKVTSTLAASLNGGGPVVETDPDTILPTLHSSIESYLTQENASALANGETFSSTGTVFTQSLPF